MQDRETPGGLMPRASVLDGVLSRAQVLESAMRRALALAERGPADDPNPRVGCAIVDGEGRIVAEGWHRGAGTPHAEVDTLSHLPAEWRGRAGELTAVVTLEPCNHTGRTGPCSRSLIDAGIGAVAYTIGDPGLAAGGGAEALRAAGVEVVGGVLADEARAVLRSWLERQGRGSSELRSSTGTGEASGGDGAQGTAAQGTAAHRASGGVRITVKWAQTIDGRAAAADGSSRWITGPEARADVHRRRAEADAILVGTGTLLADDPALTARSETPGGQSASTGAAGLLVPPAEQPVPVIVGRRPIPEGASVLDHPALAARGLAGPIRLTGDDLAADLASLSELGIRSVFVEGGPAIVSSLIAAGLVDELLVYVAPALLGGPKLALGDIGVTGMAGIKRLRLAGVERLGDDLLLVASPETASPETAPTTTAAPATGTATPDTPPLEEES